MQVRIDEALPDHVFAVHPTLGEKKVYTVYEKSGRVCHFCGLIRHELDACPDRVRLARIKNFEAGRNRQDLQNILEPKFGIWITSPTMIPKPDQGPPEEEQAHNLNNMDQSPPDFQNIPNQENPEDAVGLKRTIDQALSAPVLTPPSYPTQNGPVKKYVRTVSLSPTLSSPQKLLSPSITDLYISTNHLQPLYLFSK